uniref:RING-type E3 ubiquitin transferase n=1 Tax=Kalanchoe fedtschenkoi TaxID=63787 RepID=A0A7N0V1E0_KALFE
MIDELLDYIHVVVIQGQGLYDRPARVCMDVVEAIEIEESHVEEAVSRSIITHSESELSWLTIFDMDLEEEEESESAEDDLEEAARLSMDMLDAVNTTPPLSKFDVAAMLEGLQQVEAGEAEDGEAFLCVICMEGKCDDESGGFKQMPCNHVLHATCAHTWFRISPSCPLCRFRLKNKS